MGLLDQYLPRLFVEAVNSFFSFCVDHLCGAAAVGAGEFWRGAKQAADQGAVVVDGAAVAAKVRAA